MACSGNWVCFECRVACRRPTWRQVTHHNPETIGEEGDAKCQHCGKNMRFLGPTIKIPAKNKIKEWKRLYTETFSLRQDLAKYDQVFKVKMKHSIEKQIEELKSRKQDKERDKLILSYEKEVEKYT